MVCRYLLFNRLITFYISYDFENLNDNCWAESQQADHSDLLSGQSGNGKQSLQERYE